MPTGVAPTLDSALEREKFLLSHAERAATGTGDAVEMKAAFRFLVFQLSISAVGAGAGGASESLEVWVQQSHDGENWDDLVAFPLVAGGNGIAQVQIASLPLGRDDAAGETHDTEDRALAAGTVLSTVLARRFRAVWDLATVTACTYTFSVAMFAR